MSNLVIRPQALKDLEDISLSIDRQRIAHQFIIEARKKFELLAFQPTIGEVCKFQKNENTDMRYALVKPGWPWIIFYRHTKSGAEIIRVMDGRRNYEKELEIMDI